MHKCSSDYLRLNNATYTLEKIFHSLLDGTKFGMCVKISTGARFTTRPSKSNENVNERDLELNSTLYHTNQCQSECCTITFCKMLSQKTRNIVRLRLMIWGVGKPMNFQEF